MKKIVLLLIFTENHDCPWPDTDGDGILDKDDACPIVPGIPNLNGCPTWK